MEQWKYGRYQVTMWESLATTTLLLAFHHQSWQFLLMELVLCILSALAAELVLLASGLIQWHGRWVRSDELVASSQGHIHVQIEGILNYSTYIFHICYFWFNLPDSPWCTSVIWISPLMIRGVIIYEVLRGKNCSNHKVQCQIVQHDTSAIFHTE